MAVNLLERMPRARVREVLEESFAQFQADRGVVELAAQARRKRRSLESLEKDMTCRLGDFREVRGPGARPSPTPRQTCLRGQRPPRVATKRDGP